MSFGTADMLQRRMVPSSSNTTLPERPRRKRGPDDDMSAASFYVDSLPGKPEDSNLILHAGHIPVVEPNDPSDGHLFFVLVRNKHIADRENVLIWFNGGPGCSSFDGFLMEVGPYRMVEGTRQLKEAEGAWNEYANVIFVDQPVGTGYSYVNTNGYVHELKDVGSNMVEFLRRFYEVFPEFASMDTYLAGESYAGQYIPYIASAILSTASISTPLKGLLIGNGWIDPIAQYPAYLDMAYESGLLKKGTAASDQVVAAVKKCKDTLAEIGEQDMGIHIGMCERVLTSIMSQTIQTVNGQKVCVNNYDVRLTDTYPACGMNWPPDLSDMTPYLNQPNVKGALHATRKEGDWSECDGLVGSNFWTANSRPAITLFPDLLKQVPILLFAGDQDLICNHIGIEQMIDRLNWRGEPGWGDTPTEDWFVDGKYAGTWTTANNLTYVKVADASHMVPYDVPHRAHDMLLRFMGSDLLSAAGPSAQTPSRVGDEIESVVGSTSPNGTKSGDLSREGEHKGNSAFDNVGSVALIILGVLALGGILIFVRQRWRRTGAKAVPFPGARRSRRGTGGAGGGISSKERSQMMALPTEDPDQELEEVVVKGQRHAPPSTSLTSESTEIFSLGDDEHDHDEKSP